MTIDATSAYWTSYGNGGGTGTILRVPLAGGAPTTLAAAQPAPTAIAVGGGSVYWSAQDGVTGSGYEGQIFRLPIGGGTPTAFGEAGDSYWVGVNSSSVLWAVADRTWVNAGYYNTIVSLDAAPLAGGATVTVVSGQGPQYGPGAPATTVTAFGPIVADDENLYVVRSTSPVMSSLVENYDVLQVSLAGSGSPVTLASGTPYVAALAVDSTSLCTGVRVGGWRRRGEPDAGNDAATCPAAESCWASPEAGGRSGGGLASQGCSVS